MAHVLALIFGCLQPHPPQAMRRDLAWNGNATPRLRLAVASLGPHEMSATGPHAARSARRGIKFKTTPRDAFQNVDLKIGGV